MRFFNIDLHIAVITDIKRILESLGHTVDTKILSDHSWVLGRERDVVDIINTTNWTCIDQELCNKFYDRYKDELSGYDGFIACYPPCFAMLYEKFNKPILIDIPIRYEHPFHDVDGWRYFNQFLKRMLEENRIVLVANNKYDKKYCEHFLNYPVTHIPNICDYTGIKYNANPGEVIYYSKSELNINFKWKEKVLQNYSYPQLLQFKAIAHIPYQVSTMSIFEQYTANFPLLFPTIDFNMELYGRGVTLTEVSWNNYFSLASKSAIGNFVDDPNNYKDANTVKRWLALADYYDVNWMPYITYFSSFENLYDEITWLDVEKISTLMCSHNVARLTEVKRLWSGILERCKK